MLFENNTGYKKISIWKDEIPIFCTKQTNLSFSKSVNNTLNWHEGIICVEALLGPWHANNYAMVCMKYSSSKKESVNVIINYGMENTSFQSKVLPVHKIINVGLQLEFAKAIEEFFVECSMDRLTGGTIEILGGVYDEVGSSNIAFKKVMDILLFLFEHIDQMNIIELEKKILGLM